MTIQDHLHKYINKEIDAIEIVKIISSIFESNYAVDYLALINQITRVEKEEISLDTFKKVWGLE